MEAEAEIKMATEAVNSSTAAPVDVVNQNFVETDVGELFENIPLNKEEMDRLIEHVFLPRKLPQSQLPHQTASDESKLLSLTSEIIKSFKTSAPNILPTSTVRMFSNWEDFQCSGHLDEKEVHKSINSLEEGDMLAMYIHKQNCGLMLSCPKEVDPKSKRIFLSTFPVSMTNKTVTKSSGDLEVTFPQQSIHIPNSEILKSLSFAKQLSTLNSTDFEKAMAEATKAGTTLSNCRDVADTMFVSEWLAATLADKDSADCSSAEFPKIVKKVRDEILLKKAKGSDTLFPFRRSGLWMMIKAALQLNLTHELGRDDGCFLYKLILSQLMTLMCEILLTRRNGTLDIDLSMQMMAKLARRLEKLDGLVGKILNSSLIQIHQILHRNSGNTIEQLRGKINDQYNLILEGDKMACQLKSLGKLDFEKDTYHSIPNVRAYLARKEGTKDSTTSGISIFRPKKLGRCGKEFPSVNILQETEEVKLGVALTDVENWIFENLNLDRNFNVSSIRDLAFKYSEKAPGYYKNDPVGSNRMVLTYLKIVQVLDFAAVDSHPLLNEHKSGVDEKLISQLLLPGKKHLELAFKLEEYFGIRNKARYPSLVDEDNATVKSFSARYAAANEEMCQKRDDILANQEQKILAKQSEVRILRARVKQLEAEVAALECEYVSRWNRWKKIYRDVHSHSCTKCRKEKEISQTRVQVYERALKDEVYNQNAVVFELLIPIEIACLRDVLYSFSVEICQFSLQSTYSCENWKENSQISHYHHGQQQRTFLGSSQGSFKSSHFSQRHVSSSDDQIILRNASNCTFYGKLKGNTQQLRNKSEGSLKKMCTLQVQAGSPYEKLQWALEGTNHSQNKIIASQNQCPESISFPEWIEFGSLRSGNRLQIRNIYRAIENGRLSFKNESVLMLLLQALWESETNSDSTTSWSRDAHKDFEEDKFCEEFSGVLNKFLKTQKNNWKQPYNLLTIIMIVTRVLEINSDPLVVELFSDLLMKCRNTAVEWISSIEDVLKLSSDFELCEKLRSNLVNVGICCALTFNVDPTLPCFSKILNCENDGLKTWILALVKIDNNIILSKDKDGSLSEQLLEYKRRQLLLGMRASSDESYVRRNFLRMIRSTGIKIEKFLKEIIDIESFRSLNVLAREYFSADHKDDDIWDVQGTIFYKRIDDRNQTERCIQVDLLQGKFLVDDLPVSRLPQDIISSSIFERVFGKTVLDVQPFGKNSFQTINSFNGCKYLFRLVNGAVLITEERPGGHSYELVPHSYFQDEIIHLLVENYCHWWCREKKVIEFKQLPFDLNGDESKANKHQFLLSLENYKLTDAESGNTIIDVQSNSFRNISKFLSRFELAKYIKIFTESTQSTDEKFQATVELSRMRLKFKAVEIENKVYLESQEYEGMQVSFQHKIDGCFTGLDNGLVLEDNISGRKELFLVPHGEINASPIRNGYQKVFISLENLREPKSFTYQIDERLRQFKAGKSYSAWFYLAYLHAITSQPVEDPFTGITGVENALDILQSPHCWSSEPFDEYSLEIMASIAELTPKREFYSAGRITTMQTVTFPSFLPSTAAHDLYFKIILKLMTDSQRLKCLFSSSPDRTKNSTEFKSTRFRRRLNPYKEALKNLDDKIDKLTNFAKNTEEVLNVRAYKRHSCSNPNISVKKDFLESISIEEHNRMSLMNSPSSELEKMRHLSALAHEQSFYVPPNPETTLMEFLTRTSKLNGIMGKIFSGLRIDNWNSIDLKDSFLDLYNFVRQMNFEDFTSEWPLFLTCLAFKNSNLSVLFILQTIAENLNEFANLNPPDIYEYQNPKENYFDESRIQNIFESCRSISESDYLAINGCSITTDYVSSHSPEYNEYLEQQKKKLLLIAKYPKDVKQEALELTRTLSNAWPLDRCESSLFTPPKLVDIHAAILKINPMLQNWNRNRKLKEFLKQVSEKCKSLRTRSFRPEQFGFAPWIQNEGVKESKKEKTQINFEEKMCRQYSYPASCDVQKIFASGIFPCDYEFPENVQASNVPLCILEKRETFFHEKSEELWNLIKKSSAPADVAHLVASGIYPRIVPVKMLSRLLPKETETTVVNGLEDLIGACAVAWTYEQQAIRMIRFLKKINNYENWMRRELDTIAEETNWSPKAHPEWLLFELEMNLKIRQIQVEVAERMIKPPGETHSVMQLNMGEGKTAVIVPLLCLTLGDGKQLCRVTVLKSLYRTNLAALRHCLGGLLNRRLYAFPCRRDMDIGQDEARNIQAVYEECLSKRGVVMTLPEYILSFQLKMYETAQKKESSVAQALMKTHLWLNSNARDILDESDEILHAKYQLIYTVGDKVEPGGGNLRWKVTQGLLKLVPEKLETLLEKHGVKCVEFDKEFKESNGKEIFTPCRLLREDIYQELIDDLAEDFLGGNTSIKFTELATAVDRLIVKKFLTQRKIDEGDYKKFKAIFEDDLSQLNTVLILAGYLKYEVLRSALFKRWRVNYGVNPTGRLRMAVPFKAKDVAAEMTEFGHPDVAICLTQLSYYYSGLSDDQILECFDILEQMPNGDKYYESWLSKVSGHVDPTVENYEGLPLDDSKKCDQFLFPILRKNMYVIDFWLAKKVFPSEARQFEKKMMATPWDLCSESKNKIVTGFSGTNDSKNLLPGPISQNDLEKLEKTNENVRKTLLKEENEGYLHFSANVTGKTIIENLVSKGIPVLLDSGALMLELSNEQVAGQWLEQIQIEQKKTSGVAYQNSGAKIIKVEAAVYFNEKDVLMVKDLKTRDTELELSPYKDRLECCVVYLDDSHTRGTDLKFPVNTKACVTLGGGITRDKTVQACMRMRMLGNGHSVSFWASQEAHNSIVELCKVEEIKTEQVLKWIENNSSNFEKDGLIHWAAAGVNYSNKRAMHCYFTKHVLTLGKLCCDKELLELMQMYGSIKKEKLFTKIVETQFDALISEIKDFALKMQRDSKLRNNNFGNPSTALEMTQKTKDQILARLIKYIPTVTRFAEVLDEEQEKELQEEKERNVEISVRPEPKTPCNSKLDKNVENFLRGVNTPSDFWTNSVIELSQVLYKHNLAGLEDEEWTWGQRIFATKDFISVILNSMRYDNYYDMIISGGGESGDSSDDLYSNRHRENRSAMMRTLTKKVVKSDEKNRVSFNNKFMRPVVWIASIFYRQEMMLLLLSPHEANEYLPKIFRGGKHTATLHMYSPRLKRHQNSLINNLNLQVPSQNIFVDRHLQAQLSVFSGSLYFEDKEEQDEYCLFIGVIPRPRSEQHQQDFENGMISPSGFVVPKYRRLVSRQMSDKCNFQKSPEMLISSMAQNRHGFFPRTSHVSMLVMESKDMTYEHNQ